MRKRDEVVGMREEWAGELYPTCLLYVQHLLVVKRLVAMETLDGRAALASVPQTTARPDQGKTRVRQLTETG